MLTLFRARSLKSGSTCSSSFSQSSTLLCLVLCDPVYLLLGEKVWTKLEDESNHPRIAALIQVSVLFTALVFMLDPHGT